MADITYINEYYVDVNNLPKKLPYTRYMVIAERGEVNYLGRNSFTNCCDSPNYEGNDYTEAKAVFDELAINNDGIKSATILIGLHRHYSEWEVLVSNEIECAEQ